MTVWAPRLLGQVTIQKEGDRKGPDRFANITHVCVLHKLPHSFFTFQSRSYYPRFGKEEIWGSKRLSKLPRVDGGVWFQIWGLSGPEACPCSILESVFWGGRCSAEATVFSLERLHLQTLFSLLLWRWARAGLRAGIWRAMLGKQVLGRWGELCVAAFPLYGIYSLILCGSSGFVDALLTPVLSFQKTSWSDYVFWNNTERTMINTWQTLE